MCRCALHYRVLWEGVMDTNDHLAGIRDTGTSPLEDAPWFLVGSGRSSSGDRQGSGRRCAKDSQAALQLPLKISLACRHLLPKKKVHVYDIGCVIRTAGRF